MAFPALGVARALLLSLWLLSMPAVAQQLTVSNTVAAPLATGHSVTMAFEPGPDTGAFQFYLFGNASARDVGISGSVANGSVQCSPLEVDYSGFTCVALANSPGVDLGPGTLTAQFDIGPLTGVIPLTGSFSAYDQQGNYEGGGSTLSASIVVSGAPVPLAGISAGGFHSCGHTSNGTALCWGNNYEGQLGNGTTTDSATAVRVSGLASGTSAVSAGRFHSCALVSGGVRCWGANFSGQIGDGTGLSRLSPVAVTGLASGVTAISGKSDHNCAIVSGGLRCWGWNLYGQLGDNSTTNRSTSVPVSGLGSGVSAVATGNFHSCALTTGGGVKCWGDNFYGELGDGTTTQRNTPVNTSGLASGVAAIATGRYHSCALTTGGGVKCWGFNGKGELGDGTTTQRTTPVNVSGLASGASAIALGEQHACAITTGGGVKCWGANEFGQLGNNTRTNSAVPVDVQGLSGVVQISAGISHTCARTSSGASKCWGQAYYGQLGDNGYVGAPPRLVPVDVSGLSNGQVTLSVADASVVEGDDGQVDMVFTATLSAAAGHDVRFYPAVVPGTAADWWLDYDPYTQSTTEIPAGSTSVQFSVPVKGDTSIETDETFFVTLERVSGAGVTDGQAVGTIIDDDDASCRFIDDAESGTSRWIVSGSGAGADFVLDATHSQSPVHSWFVQSPGQVSDRTLALATPLVLAARTSPVLEFAHRYQLESGYDGGVLEYSTNGGATWQDILAANADGVPANAGRFLAGGYVQALATTHSNPLGGRQAWTGTASDFTTVRVDLSDFAGRSLLLRMRLGSDTSVAGAGWWLDDIRVGANAGCVAPALSIGDIIVAEGDAGTATATFTVSLDQASSVPVSFAIATADGTAAAGSDYTATSLQGRVIAAGETGTSIEVPILGDTQVEADESFALVIDPASVVAARIADGSAVGTITNDDTLRLSVSDASTSEGNAGAKALAFTVSLNGAAPPGGVSFDIGTRALAAAGIAAQPGVDFAVASQVARVIAAGQDSASFAVKVLGDQVREADEIFAVVLSNIAGASPGAVAATGTILDDDGQRLSIALIQGTGTTSPLLGQDVRVQGIVTAHVRDGFFLQSPDAERDADPATSEAIFVADPAMADARPAVGDRVEVQGRVFEWARDGRQDARSRTQIAASSATVLARGQALPSPVVLDARSLHPRLHRDGLERHEAMRVAAPGVTVVGPVGGFVDEAAASGQPDGIFHVVADGIARPFREPGGIDARTGARFDGNPERLRVDSLGQAGARLIAVDAGHRLAGLRGVLDQDDDYVMLPDPKQDLAISAGATARPARLPLAGESTVGQFLLDRFFDDRDDPSRDEPVLSPEAYALKLAKAANAVCAYLNSPDVLALFQAENREVLADLVAAINGKAGDVLFPKACRGAPEYRLHAVEEAGDRPWATGLLVRVDEIHPGLPRVEVLSVQPLADAARFALPGGGSLALHESTPLLLRARFNRPGGRHVELGVLAASLSASVERAEAGVPGMPADWQRARREAQARELATGITRWQDANPGAGLLVLGAFDALDFDDGREDAMAGLAARDRRQADASPRSPMPGARPLANLLGLLPAGERYTAVIGGDAQAREHILANRVLLEAGLGLRQDAARINADFGMDNLGDPAVPVRVSSRDPLVLYIGEL